jgi:hypothetical protein
MYRKEARRNTDKERKYIQEAEEDEQEEEKEKH